MAEQVAQTFSCATLGKVDEDSASPHHTRHRRDPGGHGAWASLAYCAPAIAMALVRGTRVLISTATVALQEQLVNRTCLRWRRRWNSLKFALAKGADAMRRPQARTPGSALAGPTVTRKTTTCSRGGRQRTAPALAPEAEARMQAPRQHGETPDPGRLGWRPR